MTNDILDRASRIARNIALVAATLYVFGFLVLSCLRILYPFELEWTEGGLVDHVIRVLGPGPLYCEPSIDFVPYRYTPLYYYVSAAFAAVMGIGFVPLRLVSLLSTIGCMAFILLLVKRESGQLAPAVLATGLFAATYPISGSWFDIARVDMLFLLLALAAIYVVRFYVSVRSVMIAAALISLSFLTKQLAGVVALALGFCYLFVTRHLAVFYGCLVALLIVGSALVLEHIYDGWYLFYTHYMGQHLAFHGTVGSQLRWFMIHLIFLPFAGICPLVLYYLVTCLVRGQNLGRRLFYPVVFVAMMVITFLPRFNVGWYHNAMIPSHVILAILFGLGLASILRVLQDHQGKFTSGIRLVVYAICVAQFTAMVYDPRKHVPNEADRRAGDQFLQLIASYEGEVLVPFHSHIPTLAGKQSHANRQAIKCILTRTSGPIRQKLVEDIRKDIHSQRFNTIILDHKWFEEELHQDYVAIASVFDDSDVFWPVTGWPTRPESIYVPKTHGGELETDTLQGTTGDDQSHP